MLNKSNSQSGQLLIESLVAITIIVIAIVGIFSLLSRSIGLSRVISDQYTGTYLAAEGIEVVKNIIDTNVIHECRAWNYGLGADEYSLNYDSSALAANTISPLNFNSETGLYSHNSSGEPTKFKRTIEIENIAGNPEAMHVISRVEWTTRGSAEFESVLEDTFYDWRDSAGCE